MKTGFYPGFAFSGIRKNKRLYVPYLLTCIGAVMMFYILNSLSRFMITSGSFGGGTTGSLLELGTWVMGFFSLIFLFYTNSFLIRRRKKEFGLYNVLGMGKGNIARILLWETVILLAVSLAAGLGLGIALSKLFELGLGRIIRMENLDHVLRVDGRGVLHTVVIYGVIFFLIYLNSLRQIHFGSPVELLRGENLGEKPPKANWLVALLGVVLLAAAYHLAVTIEDPILAMIWFFVAVLLVIAATYLLFIAGSVTLCRLLQKCKGYYYQSRHFVSVSSMAYRMKRNGAGLASICILATMVLVIASTTVSLYSGIEQNLAERYPRELNIGLVNYEPGTEEDLRREQEMLRSAVMEQLEKRGLKPENIMEYRASSTTGVFRDKTFLLNEPDTFSNAAITGTLTLMPLDTYNSLTGSEETLKSGEALIKNYRMDYQPSELTVAGHTYALRRLPDGQIGGGESLTYLVGTVYLVVPDYEEAARDLHQAQREADTGLTGLRWHFNFDLDASEEERNAVMSDAVHAFWEDETIRYSGCSVTVDSREANRQDYYGLYGGLLFLGAVLSVVFTAAAVLIIYYKQLCEGYEDQARFSIMRKVGMTDREIRRSVNSQMLTVFFLPLVAAGVHLAFAFPMLTKILALLNMTDRNWLLLMTAASFLVFGLFYLVVYRLTSNTYYKIVVSRSERE